MRKSLWITLTASLLGLAGLLAVTLLEEDPPHQGVDIGAPGPLDLDGAPPRGSARRLGNTPAAEIATQRFEPNAPDALAPRLKLRIIGPGGSAVEGARIRAWPAEVTTIAGVAQATTPLDQFAAAAPLWSGKSDAQGGFDVVNPVSSSLVLVAEGMAGSALRAVPFPHPEGVMTVRLLRPRPVAIQVTDERGSGLENIYVVGTEHRDRTFENPAAWTDRNGFVNFEITALQPDIYHASEFTPVVILPSYRTHRGRPTPWSNSGSTAATVRINGLVPLLVTVVDAEGQARVDDYDLSFGKATVSWGNPSGGPALLQPFTRSFRGSELRLFAQPELKTLAFATLRAPGILPVEQGLIEAGAAGAANRLKFVVGGAPGFLNLRFVTHSGRALANAKVLAEATYSSGVEAAPLPSSSASRSLPMSTLEGRAESWTTDHAGTIRVPIHPGRAGVVLVEVSEELMQLDLRSFRPVSSPLESRPFRPLSPGETIDLEPFRVAEPRVLVAGVVTDIHGRPVRGATIHVDLSSERSPFFSPSGLGSQPTRTDELGVFRLFNSALSPSPTYSVHATLGSVRSAALPFNLGDEGLELVLGASGSVVGRLATHVPPAYPMLLKFFPSRRNSKSGQLLDKAGGVRTPLDARGTFEQELAPGTWIARVSIDGRPRLTIPNIVVRPGERVADPRLDGVAVGTDLSLITVLVVDPEGLPVSGAAMQVDLHERPTPSLLFGDQRKKHTKWMTADDDGRLQVLIEEGQRLDVTVRAKGHPAIVRHNLQHDTTITIQEVVNLDVFIEGLAAVSTKQPHLLRAEPIAPSSREAFPMTLRMRAGSERTTLKGIVPGFYRFSLEPVDFPRGSDTGARDLVRALRGGAPHPARIELGKREVHRKKANKMHHQLTPEAQRMLRGH